MHARRAQVALKAAAAELPLELAHLAAALPCAAPSGGGGSAGEAAAELAGALAPHLGAADAQARPGCWGRQLK